MKRQKTFKRWRNSIWEGDDEQGKRTYLNWHLDFFQQEFLRETFRILKSGGTYWLANSFVEGSRWKILKEKFHHRLGRDEHHIFIWTKIEIEKLIQKAGFTIVNTDNCLCDCSYYIEAIKA